MPCLIHAAEHLLNRLDKITDREGKLAAIEAELALHTPQGGPYGSNRQMALNLVCNLPSGSGKPIEDILKSAQQVASFLDNAKPEPAQLLSVVKA